MLAGGGGAAADGADAAVVLLVLAAVGATCSRYGAPSSPNPRADPTPHPAPHPAPHPDAVRVQLPAHGGEEGRQLKDEDRLPRGVRRWVAPWCPKLCRYVPFAPSSG